MKYQMHNMIVKSVSQTEMWEDHVWASTHSTDENIFDFEAAHFFLDGLKNVFKCWSCAALAAHPSFEVSRVGERQNWITERHVPKKILQEGWDYYGARKKAKLAHGETCAKNNFATKLKWSGRISNEILERNLGVGGKQNWHTQRHVPKIILQRKLILL